MKIVSAEFYALGIPFRASFGHHLMTRIHSDSVVVRLISDCGHSGYGEGVPVPMLLVKQYLPAFIHIEHILLPLVGQYDFAPSILHSDVSSLLSEVDALLLCRVMTPLLPSTPQEPLSRPLLLTCCSNGLVVLWKRSSAFYKCG